MGFVSLGGGGVARAMRPLLVIAIAALVIWGAVAVGALAGVKFCHEPSAGTAF